MNNQSKLSCCNACLLAQVMKTCSTCPFNPSNIKLTAEEKSNPVIIKLLQGAQNE